MKMTAFWDIAPCRVIALMMEAVQTSETLVYFETTRCYVPEGCHLHTHCHENLKSHVPSRYFTAGTRASNVRRWNQPESEEVPVPPWLQNRSDVHYIQCTLSQYTVSIACGADFIMTKVCKVSLCFLLQILYSLIIWQKSRRPSDICSDVCLKL
jgi:hypothetical protein